MSRIAELTGRLSRLSLRWRIASTMLALVAVAGVALAAWAHLADERLKRSITLDLLSEEVAHYEHRMRVDRGAEPLRSARLSIYRSSDIGELPRHIAQLKPGPLHRVRVDGKLLDVLVRDGDFGRLYITYDVTTHQAQEHLAIVVLALGVAAILVVTAWAAIGISRRLVDPVHHLAERLTQIDPRQRHVRVSESFSSNELAPIARSIDAFMERLDGFVEREQSFTATASHELRTPLTVIRGAVELLEVQVRDRPATHKALGRIERAVREMSEFTEALLTLSREDSPAQGDEDVCFIAPLLQRIVDDQRTMLPAKRIAVQAASADSLYVRAPDSMVAMVIGNVIRNALQHGSGSDVLCRLEGHVLAIVNSGVIAKDDLARVFEQRFTTRRGGHGMGLYLARRICERYGWRISLNSDSDQVLTTVEFVAAETAEPT